MTWQKEYAGRPVDVIQSEGGPYTTSNILLLRTEYLENGGPDMTVDGSVTPVTFSWSPPLALGDILLERFQIVMIHSNITDFNSFGNLPQLANGLEVVPNFNGTPFTFVTMTRNIDFIQFSTTTNSSFFQQQGNTNQNGIQYDIQFFSPQKFNNGNLTLSVVINDNLTALDYLRANVFFSEVVP